jgi:hypothetical protein
LSILLIKYLTVHLFVKLIRFIITIIFIFIIIVILVILAILDTLIIMAVLVVKMRKLIICINTFIFTLIYFNYSNDFRVV